MMRRSQLRIPGWVLGAALVLLVGCQGTSSPVQFYALSMPEPSSPAKMMDAIALGVGPLEIPKMIDRPQIVTRNSGNKLNVDDFHRWGGALNEDILRVLTEHLTGLLQSNEVMAHPWAEYFQPDYRVYLVFHRFDGRLGESVVLNATWTVTDTRGRKSLAVRRSLIREPLKTTDYESLVFAASVALEKLSRQIAQEVKALGAK